MENKHDVYRGKECTEKFYESLREHANKVINFEKEKMNLLTKEQKKSDQNANICYICKEKFEDKHAKDIGTIVIIHGNIEVLRIACAI